LKRLQELVAMTGRSPEWRNQKATSLHATDVR